MNGTPFVFAAVALALGVGMGRQYGSKSAANPDVTVRFVRDGQGYKVGSVYSHMGNVQPIRLMELVAAVTGGGDTVESWAVPAGSWAEALNTMRALGASSGVEVHQVAHGEVELRKAVRAPRGRAQA